MISLDTMLPWCLNPREMQVISLRFGLGDGHTRTLEAVGRELNITRERVRLIEASALCKLRHPMVTNLLRQINEPNRTEAMLFGVLLLDT